MLLSIIITTKNRIEYLKQCVASVQPFLVSHSNDSELIIIDDCSDDETTRLSSADFHVPRCEMVHLPEPAYMAKARTIGAQHARGEYIFFIDDDNIVPDAMIPALLGAMVRYPTYGILGPVMYFLGANGERQGKYMSYQTVNRITGRTVSHILRADRPLMDSDGIPNAFCVRRKVFDEIGYFDDQLLQTFTEPEFAWRASMHGFGVGTVGAAKIFHVMKPEGLTRERRLGGEFPMKAYCLMRNRTIYIARAGTWHERWIYLIVFSWMWPLLYSFLMIRTKRYDIIRLYWRGYSDGVRSFLI